MAGNNIITQKLNGTLTNQTEEGENWDKITLEDFTQVTTNMSFFIMKNDSSNDCKNYTFNVNVLIINEGWEILYSQTFN